MEMPHEARCDRVAAAARSLFLNFMNAGCGGSHNKPEGKGFPIKPLMQDVPVGKHSFEGSGYEVALDTQLRAYCLPDDDVARFYVQVQH